LAALDVDIAQMPMGMHTLVAEGISTLSGGQRQRVLIARALARRPRLLLFDEATSALDNQTQAVVAKTLERLDVTRIVIAHRLSTIRGAGRIVMMVDGRIVQSGSYKELIRADGPFSEFARRQLVS
jgi:ABC-type bacteriocin/lantibiotic exporter with double-glycine peptidase domain